MVIGPPTLGLAYLYPPTLLLPMTMPTLLQGYSVLGDRGGEVGHEGHRLKLAPQADQRVKTATMDMCNP